MALNIKSRETEQVVRDLAKRTGLGITEAVHQAAIEKLRRMDEDREQRRKALYEIIERSKSLPILDTRSEDEILGYNDKGTFD
jgi:antitoxin VapB